MITGIDKLTNNAQFILNYINNNTAITCYLKPMDIYVELLEKYPQSEKLTESQYCTLLRYLANEHLIQLQTLRGWSLNEMNSIIGILNPNYHHNKLCKEFDIDFQARFDLTE